MDPPPPLFFVVLGVMGCGKSTVAAALAAALGCAFYEGDAFHSPASVDKMRAGIPLNDDDRWPWLRQLAAIVQRHLASGEPGVLSCSALKPEYRQLLRTGVLPDEAGDGSRRVGEDAPAQQRGEADGSGRGNARVAFILLDPPRALLERRLLRRAAAGGHFTPGTKLLDSQLDTLRYSEAELLLHVRADGSGGGGGGSGGGGGNEGGWPPVGRIVEAVLQAAVARGGPAEPQPQQ